MYSLIVLWGTGAFFVDCGFLPPQIYLLLRKFIYTPLAFSHTKEVFFGGPSTFLLNFAKNLFLLNFAKKSFLQNKTHKNFETQISNSFECKVQTSTLQKFMQLALYIRYSFVASPSLSYNKESLKSRVHCNKFESFFIVRAKILYLILKACYIKGILYQRVSYIRRYPISS
jgi:hypothetical protein